MKEGDYIAKNVKLHEDSVEFTVNKSKDVIRLHIPGRHNVLNGILCYIVSKELGVTDQDLREVEVAKSAMRMDVLKYEQLTVINDCYNASPDSMKAALHYLAQFSGRKVAVLGTMRELGEESLEAHKAVALAAKERGIDQVLFVGEYQKAMVEAFGEGALGVDTFEEAQRMLKDRLKKEDVVLLKASRGMYFERFLPILEELGGNEEWK